MRAVGWLATTVLWLSVVASASFAATTVELIKGPSEDNTVIRGDGRGDRIKVRWLGDGAFSVQGGGRLRGDRCASSGRRRIDCTLGGGVAYFDVFGRAGVDRITLRGRFPSYLIPGITGNGGSDVLHGSSRGEVLTGNQGDDELNGGDGEDSVDGESSNIHRPLNPGDDTLRGGPGADELGDYFEPGVDRFFGGPGWDVIDATDRARDGRINGGPGKDLCRIDRQDPRPRNCERIKITAPSPYD